ncbi:N-acetylglucosamine-6-phosphate deacetylase [Petrocella sp. FN5]|uniref:N-acetylglucosamine-6-phosphate deacetylase n=1 Tax=Petrocella sp. FN5 TaxID=3032002 RepID=UPI0023DC6318|nr:N-acetylglucosamine-6-phosphate deacetylase [Petrocella sp. FN5]MDF1617382.1 N-acetylglucosamine-6-phosphate deacetylase [Petrocella sp. FN5]
MKGIKGGLIYHQGKFYEDYVVLFEDEINLVAQSNQINYREDVDWIDAGGHYVIPGLIDVHIHGYKGHDVMDGDEAGLKAIAKGITENGVTSFLPTTMTMETTYIEMAIENIKKVMLQPVEGAEILGVHMEGPYISKIYKGAQSEKAICLPDQDFVEKYKDVIKVITMAPELEGSKAFIEALSSDINISLGHTGATYEQAREAIKSGAKSVTHLFNAMTGLHHREPGVVGAALATDCYAELIADEIHVHPSLFQVIAKIKGLEKLLLVTDCMCGGGLSEGEYELGGQKVSVKEGTCTLEDGTLAGSVLKLNEALGNFDKNVTEELEKLLPLATLNQATYLGISDKKGSIDVGKDADLVIMDRAFTIQSTFVKGRKVYEI